jgi:protein-S-isoprenylcysteine O-methyltransferase
MLEISGAGSVIRVVQPTANTMSTEQVAGLALIAFGMTECFLRRGATARSIKTTTADKGTTPLIFGSYAAVVCLLFLPTLPGAILPVSVAWMGVGLAFAGLVFRWWAVIVLGRFYTRTLTTTPEQSVVTRGPYRWIRHPGYLGSLLTWTGAAVASKNVFVCILVLSLLVWAYMLRIRAEEAMLVESLGVGYTDYQQKSWRLLPFLF